jgi:hypothetical protein
MEIVRVSTIGVSLGRGDEIGESVGALVMRAEVGVAA